MLELLQIGRLGMTKVSSSVLENFAPAYQVLSLPFVFRDDAHRFAVLDGPDRADELLAAPEPYRLRGLAFYDAGSRSFYTVNRPDPHAGRPAGREDPGAGERDGDGHGPHARAGARRRSRGASCTRRSSRAWSTAPRTTRRAFTCRATTRWPSTTCSNEHTAVPDVLIVGTTLVGPARRRSSGRGSRRPPTPRSGSRSGSGARRRGGARGRPRGGRRGHRRCRQGAVRRGRRGRWPPATPRTPQAARVLDAIRDTPSPRPTTPAPDTTERRC